jgi:Mrp family chromosome partitioning ATPase
MRAARAHRWLIAAVAAVAVLSGVLWIVLRPSQYEASAQVLVTPLSDTGSYTGLPVLTNSSDPTRTQETAATILESSSAAAATARAVRGWTTERVRSAVAVEPQGGSNIVTVTATADSPAAATAIANQYALNALATRSEALRAQAAAAIKGVQAQREALGGSDSSGAAELARELGDLQRIRDGQDPNFSLLQAAGSGTATGSPASLVIVLALLAGLVVGGGAAVLLEHLNRYVRDEEELLALYPLPVLTRVPPLPAGSADAVSPELVPPRVQEAFRTLDVLLEGPEDRGRTIMLTSASKGDGKTTAAIHLAMALSATGARVILLDFDLRKPELGARLGTDSDVMGLFGPDATLGDVLASAPSVPGLSVLGSRQHENVLPLLEAMTRRIPDLLAEARKQADFVVIDTPPLGEVSDALRVAGVVDAMILVARFGNTDRTDLQQARELLERMGHVPAGLLVMGDTTDRRDAYGYGYGRDAPPSELSRVPALDRLRKAGRQ